MGCGVSSVPPKAKRNEKGENKSLTNQIKTKLVQNTEDYGPIPLAIQKESSFIDYVGWAYKLEEDLKSKLRKRKKTIPWVPIKGKKVTTIRPFLSSTFRDFNEERNRFFKNSCPKLEKICAGRGVQFVPLDLRWGVTQEESSSGEVIRLCNEEIDNCRPYFVCSLGFRNGWCLSTEYEDKLLEKTFDIAIEHFEWVKDYRNRSVTEIEIQHGALRSPHCRCFFYFRTAEYLQRLEEGTRKHYIDRGRNAQKLAKLKHAIVDAGFQIKWFSQPDEMVDLLHEDMLQLIDKDCKVESAARKPHVVERKTHATFRQRNTHLFIDHDSNITKLDQVLGNGKKVFVFGDFGSGKSALITNWVQKLIDERTSRRKSVTQLLKPITMNNNDHFSTPQGICWNTNINIIERYMECSNYTESLKMLHLINTEIQQMYNTDMKLDFTVAAEQFIDILNLVSLRAPMLGPLLLVIDGLNHMTGENDNVLAWLPDSYPPGVALLASCSNSKVTSDNIAYKSLIARKCDANIRVKLLNTELARTLMNRYLKMYGKKVDEAQQKLVLDSPHTRQPLFLMTLLNEIRVFGDFFGVTDRLKKLLAVDEGKGKHPVSNLFQKVLQKVEGDYERNHKGLTKCVTSSLYLAKMGLTEPELQGIVEMEMKKSVGIILSTTAFDMHVYRRLWLRLQSFLMSDTEGRYRFKNEFFCDAVAQRYHVSKSDAEHSTMLISVHRLLATFFDSCADIQRRAEELPYHLFRVASLTPRSSSRFARASERLRDSLLDLRIFRSLCRGSSAFELHKYWQQAEKYESGDKSSHLAGLLLKSLKTEEDRLVSAHQYGLEMDRTSEHATPIPKIKNFLPHQSSTLSSTLLKPDRLLDPTAMKSGASIPSLMSTDYEEKDGKSKKREKKEMKDKKGRITYSGTLRIVVQTNTNDSQLSLRVGTNISEENGEVLAGKDIMFLFELEVDGIPLDEKVVIFRRYEDDVEELVTWKLSDILKPMSKLEMKLKNDSRICISSIEEICAEMYYEVGIFLVRTRPWDGTEAILERSLELLEKAPFRRAKIFRASGLLTHGALCQKQGRIAKALASTEEALALNFQLRAKSEVRSSTESDAIIRCQGQVAVFKAELGDLEGSKIAYRDLVQDLESKRKEDPTAAEVYAGYGNLLLQLQQPEEAQKQLLIAQQLMVRYRGPHSDSATKVRGSLAACYVSQGKFADALAMYEKIQKSKLKLYGDDHPELVVVYNGVASALFRQEQNRAREMKKPGNFKRSIQLLKSSLTIMEKLHGPEHMLLLPTINKLVIVYSETDMKQSRHYAERCLKIIKKGGGKASKMQEKSAHLVLAKVAIKMGDLKEHMAQMQNVCCITAKLFGTKSREYKKVKEKIAVMEGPFEEIMNLEKGLTDAPEGSEIWSQKMHDLAMAYCEADMFHKGLEIATRAKERSPLGSDVALDIDGLIEHINAELDER